MGETKEPPNGWGIWREKDGTWWVQRRPDIEPEKVFKPRSEDWEQAYKQGLRDGDQLAEKEILTIFSIPKILARRDSSDYIQ